jgi:hypothetical protein
MELSSGGTAFHWFGMPMLQWQRDEKLKAKEWYEKAVEWAHKNAPKDKELRRFRAESEQLMGIEHHVPKEEVGGADENAKDQHPSPPGGEGQVPDDD